MRIERRGSGNPNWVGDKIKRVGLHRWVRKHKPEPAFCEICGSKPPHDLANKGIYDKNLDNWEYLCRKCHMTKDGRLEKATENIRNRHKIKAP